MKKPFSRYASAAAFFVLLPVLAAANDWVPFRVAIFDSYPDVETYEREASDIYGFRLGLGNSINKRVYGFSLSLLADGGSSLESPENATTPIFVDDDFIGAKIGGVFNASCGSGFGLQVAGIGATTDVRMTGAQVAGVLCDAQYMNGFQIAGLASSVGLEMHAVQVGGLVARCGFSAPEEDQLFSTGVQLSALFSVCKGSFVGFQGAGLGVRTGTLSGVQIAGIFAGCDDGDGLQLGCITYAKSIRGIQIGVLNIAKSLYGVQIGVINAVGTLGDADFSCFPILNAKF